MDMPDLTAEQTAEEELDSILGRLREAPFT